MALPTINTNVKPFSPSKVERTYTKNELILMLKNGSDMWDVVQSIIDRQKLPYILEEGELKDTLTPGQIALNAFITVDDATIKLKEDALLMSKCDHEVLITGETGTGKELIAKSMIADRKGKLQAANCAGFPTELIESELFGHARGAFTGAMTEKEGLLSAAKDGVMFLDEIGELPMFVQAKLLRALQEKKIRKVGSNNSEDISCKIVCATHRNLKKMVEEGTFRRDLYARISTLELDIKPLEQRRCDVVPITESLQGGKEFLDKIGSDVTTLPTPLNVRSLQQYVIRFNILGRVITW
jgi:transcriptional regulator with PAS, ATPase and Fis domain